MGSLGPMEIALILLAVLLLFGAKRIPEIARGLGKGIREFKSATREISNEFNVDDRSPRIQSPGYPTTPRETAQQPPYSAPRETAQQPPYAAPLETSRQPPYAAPLETSRQPPYAPPHEGSEVPDPAARPGT